MPTLLTPANVREHVETDLSDTAIQRLLDDVDAEIIRRYGPHGGPLTEIVDGREGLIILSRPILTVTSITERNGLTDTALAVDDWRQWYNRALERLDSGTNGAEQWGERITIVYTPADEQAQRKRVELDLVKLDIHYEAVKAQVIGDYNEVSVDFGAEREMLYGQLGPALSIA